MLVNKNPLEFLPLRLKAARRARGFDNRLMFAKYCKVSISTYRMHELGKRELKVSDLWKYAEKLDISKNWLLTGEGHPLDHKKNTTSEELTIFKHFLKVEEMLLTEEVE